MLAPDGRVVADLDPEAVVEHLDAAERARGGCWREARTLAPGEVTISDERLT